MRRVKLGSIWCAAALASLAGCEEQLPGYAATASAPDPAVASVRSSASSSPPVAAPDPACRTLGSRMLYLARWSQAERDSLAAAMRKGTAVLAIDECKDVRLLTGCNVSGRYGYLGTVAAPRAVPLLDEEQRRVNAPLLAGAKETSADAIHLQLTMVGQWKAMRLHLEPAEMKGDCTGATHFVSEAHIGAQTVAREALAVAIPDACRKAKPLDAAAPDGCNDAVLLRVEPVIERERLIDAQDFAKLGPVVELGICPRGMVIAANRCARPPVDGPHLCKLGDADDCKRQCDADHFDSCDVLGSMYLHGPGVARDPKAAARVYTKSCKAHDGIACFALGQLWEDGSLGENEKTAASYFEQACSAGERAGCASLGAALFRGEGVTVDKPRGLSLLEQACIGGAGCMLYALALTEDGADKPNVKRAFTVLEEACELHSASSCAMLGRFHYDGQGGPADASKAARYFDLACKGREPSACVALAGMYRKGDGVKADDSRAAELLQSACEDGSAPGCLNLGTAYEHGKGVEKDVAKAAQLYETACEAKNGVACGYFADFLRAGTGVKADPARAKALYTHACKLGYEQACNQR